MAAREGDWQCVSCSKFNFARRSRCFHCRHAKARAGDWTCPKCNFLVFGSKPACAKCGSTKPENLVEPVEPVFEPVPERLNESKLDESKLAEPKVGYVVMHIDGEKVACVALHEQSSDVLGTFIADSLDAAAAWAVEQTNGRFFGLVATGRSLAKLANFVNFADLANARLYDFDDLMQRHTGSSFSSLEQTVARLEQAGMSKRLDRSGLGALDYALDMGSIFKGMQYRGLWEKRIPYI
jgi:hypothetical protein